MSLTTEKLSLALGLILPGVYRNEATMYSYNGVVLPKLPEWDRESYPYAVMASLGSMYELYVTDKPSLYFRALDDCVALASSDAVTLGWVNYSTSSGAWSTSFGFWECSASTGLLFPKGPVIWANYDVYWEDGSLCVAASDPIPVYE